jgi:hypothetical protein
LLGAEATLQPTAWIPLIDATVENGCMQVKKGAHLTGKVARHTCCVGIVFNFKLESCIHELERRREGEREGKGERERERERKTRKNADDCERNWNR